MVEALLDDGDLGRTVKLTAGAIRQRRYEARRRGEAPDLPPVVRIGNRYRYLESDVRAWLASKVENREMQVAG